MHVHTYVHIAPVPEVYLIFLIPENWYKITPEHYINEGGQGLLTFYKGNAVQPVVKVYKSHNWNLSKFVANSEPKKEKKDKEKDKKDKKEKGIKSINW